MNSDEMVVAARKAARHPWGMPGASPVADIRAEMKRLTDAPSRTQQDAIEAQLHLQQLRQAGMIARDIELLYTPMIFGDPPLVHGPRLWDKGRYAVNVTNTYEDRLDQQRD